MNPDNLLRNRKWPVVGLGILLVAAGGCATKKHVRTVVQPVETRVGTLEQKNTENEKASRISKRKPPRSMNWRKPPTSGHRTP